MPHLISLNDTTWLRLQAMAVPLQDSAEDVINRLLDAAVPGSAPAHDTHAVSAFNTANRSTMRIPRRRSPKAFTAKVLAERGLIKPGTRIAVLTDRLPAGVDPLDRRFTARFAEDARHVLWDFDDSRYTLSRLTLHLRETAGIRAASPSENGFRAWGLLEDREVSLEEWKNLVLECAG